MEIGKKMTPKVLYLTICGLEGTSTFDLLIPKSNHFISVPI